MDKPDAVETSFRVSAMQLERRSDKPSGSSGKLSTSVIG